MERKEEYELLLQTIREPEAVADTLTRAKKRYARRKMVTRPLVGVLSAFVIFVGLVNFCTPVAYACSKVPLLRELAEAVTFSRSLSDAVTNEYMQEMNLFQVDGDISVSVDYLIVDQKQVNVFYRVFSDVYEEISVEPLVKTEIQGGLSYGLNNWDVPNGEMQSITIDFIGADVKVPEKINLQLRIRDMSVFHETEQAVPLDWEDSLLQENLEEKVEYLAEFEFTLEFDPQYTANGKVLPIEQTLSLDGQEIIFTDAEIYPTHMRINIRDAEGNTAWLKSLNFYVETDWGMRFELPANGIVSTGGEGTRSMTSYRADSPYFYDAKHMKIVITGAEWLDKEKERAYVNLKTGETEHMPDGISLRRATQREKGWILEMQRKELSEDIRGQMFLQSYYDREGNEYTLDSWSTTREDGEDGTIWSVQTMPLKGYVQEEVWLSSYSSHSWTPKEPVKIVVK